MAFDTTFRVSGPMPSSAVVDFIFDPLGYADASRLVGAPGGDSQDWLDARIARSTNSWLFEQHRLTPCLAADMTSRAEALLLRPRADVFRLAGALGVALHRRRLLLNVSGAHLRASMYDELGHALYTTAMRQEPFDDAHELRQDSSFSSAESIEREAIRRDGCGMILAFSAGSNVQLLARGRLMFPAALVPGRLPDLTAAQRVAMAKALESVEEHVGD